MPGKPNRLAGILILAAVYFATARAGLMLGSVSTLATLIWPPTGIALAALVLFGLDLWPGVALGAFLVNWMVGGSVPLALAIAFGNTSEALIAAALLARVGFDPSLSKLRSVGWFVALAALISTLFSATIGVSSLAIAGKLSASYGTTWRVWWLGDVMGNLIVAPLLLIIGAHGFGHLSRRLPETLGLLALVLVTCLFFFTDALGFPLDSFPRPYLAFPVLILVAIRLGPAGTATALILTAGVVLSSTASEHGRFWVGTLSASLLEAQVFLAIVSITSLVISAVTFELKQTELDLKKAVRARDEFLSVASHELKTPLTTLKLQAQLRRRNLEKGELTAKNVVDDERQIGRLARLVDDMLDVSRISSGKFKLAPEDFDLSELVKEVVERFGPQLLNAKIAISVEAPKPVTGHWDRPRIEQVFTNLLTNAMKYGEGRPVAISVALRSGFAELEVADNGLGIQPSDHDRIFHAFERAAPSGVSGLGLGLYIAKQLVEAHGGTIHVESANGQGARFIVGLPLHSVR
jgi:signal transduction histidine kinase